MARALEMSGHRRTGSSSGSGAKIELRSRPRQTDDRLRQLPDRDLVRVAEVERAGRLVGLAHEAHDALDQIVDVAERAGLVALAVDRDRLAGQRLHDEVRHHAPVLRVHPGAVGVEDARHLDADLVLAQVVEEERLGAALALVVAGARADGVRAATVLLDLRVHLGIAVDLAGGGLEDLRAGPLGQAQHVDGAVDAGLGRRHRIVLVVNRRGRAGHVVDVVHLDVERERDVVPQDLEHRVVHQVHDVRLAPREIVVGADHVVTVVEEPLAEVRAQKARTAGHQDTLRGQHRRRT